MEDMARAAERRRTETPEQREKRLRKDRERANRRRLLRTILDRIKTLNGKPEYAQLKVPMKVKPMKNGVEQVIMTPLQSMVKRFIDPTSVEELQQVLEVLESKKEKCSTRRITRFQNVKNNLGCVDKDPVIEVDKDPVIDIEIDDEFIEEPNHGKKDCVSCVGNCDSSIDINVKNGVPNSENGVKNGRDGEINLCSNGTPCIASNERFERTELGQCEVTNVPICEEANMTYEERVVRLLEPEVVLG